MDSVSQYVDNNSQVLDLHRQMQECDAVLARMQSLLLGFQDDLGGISEEIKHLQDESLSMSIRLKNRRAAEEVSSVGLQYFIFFILYIILGNLCELNYLFIILFDAIEITLLHRKCNSVSGYG